MVISIKLLAAKVNFAFAMFSFVDTSLQV